MLGDILGMAFGLLMVITFCASLYRVIKDDDPLGIKTNINIFINVKQEDAEKKE